MECTRAEGWGQRPYQMENCMLHPVGVGPCVLQHMWASQVHDPEPMVLYNIRKPESVLDHGLRNSAVSCSMRASSEMIGHVVRCVHTTTPPRYIATEWVITLMFELSLSQSDEQVQHVTDATDSNMSGCLSSTLLHPTTCTKSTAYSSYSDSGKWCNAAYSILKLFLGILHFFWCTGLGPYLNYVYQ